MLFNKPLQLATIVILAIVGSLYWYAGKQQQRYNAEATQFLTRALTDIASWQRDALRRQLAEEALRAVDNAQLDALVDRYRPLGAFKRIDELQFARLTAALSLFGRDTLLSYHGNAHFEHGTAALTATLVVRDGQFSLYNFSLASPQLRRAN